MRKAASSIDQLALDKVMENHVKEVGVDVAFEFGVYSNLPISHAVRGHALAAASPLLKKILVLCPDGTVNQKPLSDGLETAAYSFRELAPRSGVGKWAADRAYAIFVMLNHLRRLKYSPLRQRQAKGAMTAADWIAVELLLSRMEGGEADGQDEAVREEFPLSQISLDSERYPKLCGNSFDSPPAKDQRTVAYDEEDDLILSAQFTPIPATKALMRQARIEGEEKESSKDEETFSRKKPAAATASKSAPKPKPAPAAKPALKAAAEKVAAEVISYKVNGKNVTIKLGCYTKQSYIQCKEASKWKLWAAISQNQSSRHAELMRQVFFRKPPNAVAAISYRDKIVQCNSRLAH